MAQAAPLPPDTATSEAVDKKQLLATLLAVKKGDFSVRMLGEHTGIAGKIVDTLNEIIERNEWLTKELERISIAVGKEGKITQRAMRDGAGGAWASCIDSVNALITDLAQPTTEVARVIGAVAKGDLSQTMELEIDGRPLRGEFLRTGKVVNTMVERLSAFASEVTRVAREVGTEGKLGGQAQVKGVSGTWKDLTDNVNFMASNLTGQVRNIAEVTTAVARGDLSKKITVDVKGEILELKNTINTMVDQLNSFASEVTRVAREVGIDGKLGGQASVPGASGTWRDLTDNVNRLAANLTNQVRAMADVATAVTKGDLTRSITVEAAGEVAYLKDTVNEMIRNLKDTTRKNTEQDWLKTNLTKFTRLLQGEKDLWTVSRLILSELAPLVNMQHGVFYIAENTSDQPVVKLLASYAYKERKQLSNLFALGEGLVGQCALEKQRILITDVPPDYIKINSGLGEATPLNIVVLPVLFEEQLKAVIELASFHRFNDIHLQFLDQLMESIGIVLNTIKANMRTEELLKQSQSLTQGLQSGQLELQETNRRLELQAKSLQASEELLKKQQEELQQTNEQLEEKARLLSEQNAEVERKNHEIEQARRALEEKAEQLLLTSKYKSEFLANMSHELRTPLNSMLILSKMLAENAEGNLTEKQVEYAETVHSSGVDLLALIYEILDLSKIESGTMSVEISEVSFGELKEDLTQLFMHVARDKGLAFTVELDPRLPETIQTDAKRLQQVLKNLLSNAFKFTEKGEVVLRAEVATGGWSYDNDALNRAASIIAFSVCDTGVGIPANKHKIIFEAFQQADGTTSRKYGGTGLGLSISREIARLLGGEIRLESTPGQGSTFTLYLPAIYLPNAARASDSGVSVEPEVHEAKAAPVEEAAPLDVEVIDDHNHIQAGDRVLLIVEDDLGFASLFLDTAHQCGFKGIIATGGEESLLLARKFRPEAITLDLLLPGMQGLAVLDRLKSDPATRHIPVHVISVVREDSKSALRMGALGHLTKPATKGVIARALGRLKEFVERPVKNLLVVEGNEEQRASIVELIGDHDVATTAVGSAREALDALVSGHFDCAVIGLALPDMDGAELIADIRKDSVFAELPIIAYSRERLTKREEAEAAAHAERVIAGPEAMERLLDETALFLHRVEADLPELKREMLERLRKGTSALAGKKVLVVDDDIRNIFAITSLLERHKMEVVYAENGKEGVELLKRTPGIDCVLMDIMMPGMDGLEAMHTVRQMEKFRNLPIIAVTAKAMKGDRQKCIEAGASDYITKPIENEQLLSLLRVWLGKGSREVGTAA